MTQDVKQVEMVWAGREDSHALSEDVPDGYLLRTYQPGDEGHFFRLMDLVGWSGWDYKTLKPWLFRAIPEGWFMVVEKGTDLIVASTMATHDPTWKVPFSGEIGWVSCHPDHRSKGLGTAVVSSATNRLLDAGYSIIHLYTETYRIPAIKVYLKLGYIPLWYRPEGLMLWHEVCEKLDIPFQPDKWEKHNHFILNS